MVIQFKHHASFLLLVCDFDCILLLCDFVYKLRTLLRDFWLYPAFHTQFVLTTSCPQSCLVSSLMFATLPTPLSCPILRNLFEDYGLKTEDATLFCIKSISERYRKQQNSSERKFLRIFGEL